MSVSRGKLLAVLAMAVAGVAGLLAPTGGGPGLQVAHAAPVPDQKAAKKKELDFLWADLKKDDPAASRAVIGLYKQPEHAVPYLKAKLLPLKLDADRCTKLLADLGSEDEKTWKAAWEELDYLDPRLAIDLQTLMNDVTANPARTRMVELFSERQADSLVGKKVFIRVVGNEGYNFSDGRGSWWAEHKVERIGALIWTPKIAWVRANRGVAILEQIGTPEAAKVLEAMATGHEDAAPTKAAKEALERLKKK